MTAVALFGAGRIGKIHAANLAAQPGARLKYVVDTHQPSAQELAAQYGASVSDIDSALADPEVGAVVIASSTDTHADLILRAARMARPSSARKPVDLTLERARQCAAAVKEAGVACLIGFQRRYDPTLLR
jgi:myo-inositol 2-dehydrogenase/D-chiro-inositol 1-dehydrogenase